MSYSDTETKATKEMLQTHLIDYLESITTKKSKQYICPICNSGARQGGTPAFNITTKNNKPVWHCFSCGNGGDIFDLVGIVERLDTKDSFKKVFDLYGNKPASTLKPKPQANENMTERDFTNFYLQANKDIDKTTYHRGLTAETLNKYKVGFVPNWKHPDHPTAPESPRLIIPITAYSYLARDTRTEQEGANSDYKKQKVKGKDTVIWTFNSKALKKATRPIFIVEGEIDALSIIDIGGEAVAIGSINYVRHFLNLVEQERPTQPFIICLDNDGNPDTRQKVEKATNDLEKGLKDLGITVYRGDISGEYKDANEHLNANRQAFKNAVERAENIAYAGEGIEQPVSEKIDDFIEFIYKSAQTKAIPTGFTNLDNALGGGLYAGLYVMGAISSLGKTTFSLQIADQIAQQGYDVLIFSLEMATNELIGKSVSRLTYRKARERQNPALAQTTRSCTTGAIIQNMSPLERQTLKECITEYRKTTAKHIYIYEGVGDIGIEKITKVVKEHTRRTGKAPVVFIDYLQILAPYNIRYTEKQNTDKAVLELKRLSRDLNTPIWVISSFNRENYTEPVGLTAFKESGAIEYTADLLLGMQYDGMDYIDNEKEKDRLTRIRKLTKDNIEKGKQGQPQDMQVKILKNRNGAKGDINLKFTAMYNIFEETAQATNYTTSTKYDYIV